MTSRELFVDGSNLQEHLILLTYSSTFFKMKNIMLAFALVLCSANVSAQTDGMYYWKQLAKIQFASQFNAATGDVAYAPVFSSAVRELKSKEIVLKGYILPVQSRDGTVILSCFPFSSCYFCGGAGPETVIEVHPKFPIVTRSNKPVTLKGRLSLNEPYDMLYLPYFLLDAEVFTEEN